MELIYTAHIQNSTEIMEFLWSKYDFFIIIIPLILVVNLILSGKKIKDEPYFKYLGGVMFLFFSLSIFADYYALTNLSSSLKRALGDKQGCKYIEGSLQEYSYRSSIRRELFLVNGVRFDIQNNPNPNGKRYPKLISIKGLRLKVEYISFPKHNTTAVRIWKL